MEGENNTNQNAEPTPQATPEPVAEGATPLVAGERKTLMAVLAYVGILIIIPYLIAKEDAFVKYHLKQGLVLFVIELIVWVVGSMSWGFNLILDLVNLAVIVLSIVGIVNVLQGKEKELPLVGQFSKNFNI